MNRVVISEFMDERAVSRLAEVFGAGQVLYDPALVDDRPRLLHEAATADAIIVRNRTQVRGELLAALQRCRVVGRLGVGLDNIDVDACAARSIEVIPATGANARSVAEYVIATSMLLLRGAYASTAAVAAGSWPRGALSAGRELGAKTIGIVGFGSVGQLTAMLAVGLGVRVVAFDAQLGSAASVWAESGVAPRSLDELIADADVVSLHVPLDPSTRHLIDARRIAAMKPGAVLVNTARGGIVDEAAVADALRRGHLGGAALDVFEHEPLGPENPFEGCPNLILTPHIAGVSMEANERVSFLIADRIIAALGAGLAIA